MHTMNTTAYLTKLINTQPSGTNCSVCMTYVMGEAGIEF